MIDACVRGCVQATATLCTCTLSLNFTIFSTRSLGSAAIHMMYVAEGRIDSYCEFGLHCWDYAAPSIIVEEAGGAVTDTDGAALIEI